MGKALNYAIAGCIIGLSILLAIPPTQSHCRRDSIFFGIDTNISAERQTLVFLLPTVAGAWLGWSRRERN